MKKLLIVCLVLFVVSLAQAETSWNNGAPELRGPLTVFGSVYKYITGVRGDVVTETTGNVTLYVRTTGSDLNDGLTSGNPLLTIQAAVSRIPKFIKHTVEIDIGAGTFVGFVIDSFTISSTTTGKLDIHGTISNFTPATGPGSGNADSGSTMQCGLAGAGWTVNDLRGKLVYVNSEYRFIRSNAAATFELVGPLGATCNGKAFVIKYPATIINAPYSNSIYPYTTISATTNLVGLQAQLRIRDFAIDGVLGNYDGPAFRNSAGGLFERIYINSCYWGMNIWQPMTPVHVNDVFVENCIYAADGFGFAYVFAQSSGTKNYVERILVRASSIHGFDIWASYSFMGTYLYAEDITGIGFYAYGNDNLDLGYMESLRSSTEGLILYGNNLVDIDDGTIDTSGTWGIIAGGYDATHPWGTVSYGDIESIVCSNNVTGCMLVDNRSNIRLTNMTGAGNGLGVSILAGSDVLFNSGVTVTGASGDVTLNGGVNYHTWASCANGDSIVNTASLSRAERRD